MVDVKELYSEEEYISRYSGKYTELYDYDPMINAFGRVAVRVDTDDYSGDTYILYDNGNKIGHLIFGWGSCSGCDPLQHCESIEEVQELCDKLENSIEWFGSKEEALNWFENHDWKGNWCWFYKECREYIEKAMEYLKGEN